MGTELPPGVQSAIDEDERRKTIERSVSASAATLKELSVLLEREHQARIKAQKQAEDESKKANRLACCSLWISILSAVFTIVGVAVDLYATFHGL